MNFVSLFWSDYWPYFDFSDIGQDYPVSSFSVEHSLDGLSTATITIPYGGSTRPDKILEDFINKKIGISIGKGNYYPIFNGIITDSNKSQDSMQINAKSYLYLFQKIFNPALAFTPEEDGNVLLDTAINELISGSLQTQGISDMVAYHITGSIADIYIPPSEHFPNTDNYSVLKNLADMGNCMVFEKLINGQPTIIICPFTEITNTPGTQELNISGLFYERTKSYSGDNVINALIINVSDKWEVLYPYTEPPHLAPDIMRVKSTDTPTGILSEINTHLNGKYQSGIAVYPAQPRKKVNGQYQDISMEELGNKILYSQMINFTSATYKMPGIPRKGDGSKIIGMPGDKFTSEAGTGMVNKVIYEFNDQMLWQTYEIIPRVGW